MFKKREMRQVAITIILFWFCNSVFGQITMQKINEGILIVDGSEKVFFYQVKPKSKKGEFARNNYIHPLYSIDGEILTEDFPEDHLHHRGIFWAWHQVYIGEKRIGDPWLTEDFIQDISEIEFIAQKDGGAILNAEVLWKSPKWKKDGKMVPYLKEYLSISIHEKVKNYRQLDFEISLIALEDDLKIGGSEDAKGYSGFSARVKLPDGVEFSGENGMVTPETNAVEAGSFINISGNLEKNNALGGVVMVCNSENPGYPQKWILRNKRSMQNAVYPGRELVPVLSDEPTELKYSLIIYNGKLKTKKIKKIIGD